MKADDQRLTIQFAKSLQNWGGWEAAITGEQTHLITPANELVEKLYLNHPSDSAGKYKSREDEWVQMLHLSRSFVNACLVQEVYHATGRYDLKWLLETVESPIEALMLMSLILCAREYRIGVIVIWTQKSHVADVGDFELWRDFSLGNRTMTLEIRPQAQLGNHRVDFLLSHYGIESVQRPQQVPSSLIEKQEVRVDKKMIVECDGHDFHERTKDQASRDKERDRNLQSSGYQVFRYSGSDVYKDVFRCSVEIMRVLTGLDYYSKDWQQMKKTNVQNPSSDA